MTLVLRRFAGVALTLLALGWSAAVAQVATTYNGILAVTWGDPKPGVPGGGVRFKLLEPDGTVHPLEVAPASQSRAVQFSGKRVTVRGHATERAAGGASTIVVDDIDSANERGAAPAPRTALGTKNALILLLKFQGDSQKPHSISFYKDLFNPMSPVAGSGTPTTINGFFDRVSWGQLKFAATVGGNKWFTLPGNKHHYAPCDSFGAGCTSADTDLIAQDALALAVADGINIAAYDSINFVLNNDLDCCAWGGQTFFNGVLYDATWEPPWAQHAETYVHELGHSIGLPHSGWKYYAYDSPWDIMSMHNEIKVMTCGSYRSMNSGNTIQNIDCPEPGSGYIVAHKDFLGWIPDRNKVVIDAKTSATGRNVTLSAGATGLGTNKKKMIKVCLAGQPCTGSSAHFLTVEAKIATARYDNGAPNDGVVIHDVKMDRGLISGGCYFNNQSGWAVPIDATRGDFNSATCSPETSQGSTSGNAALGNAQFEPGMTYSNTTYGIKVKVKAAVTDAYTVTVIRTK
jgi:hypothetical protein